MLSFVNRLAAILSRAGVLLIDLVEYVQNLSNRADRATVKLAARAPEDHVRNGPL
jgi:hypothetical protein